MTVLIIAAAWIVVSFAAGLVLGRVLRGRSRYYPEPHGVDSFDVEPAVPYDGPIEPLMGPYECSSAYTPESTARLRDFVNADQPLPEDEIRGRS